MLTALVALAIAATHAVWRDIFTYAWGNEELSYVFLGPPIVVWLAWVRRHRLRYCKPQRTVVGAVVIAGGWALSAYGFHNGVDLAWHGGALLIVIGAVITVLGLDVLWHFLPAFGALVFMLPVPGRLRQAIAYPLQEVSARVTEVGLDLFNFPVTRGGNILTINGVEVAIAEACNGMRMVVALGLIAYAFIFSIPMRNSVRLIILISSPLIALAVNLVRLVPTALLYGYRDLETAEFFHDVSGWAVLALALGLLWCVLGLLRWIEVPISPYPVGEEG
jgi:exosortase